MQEGSVHKGSVHILESEYLKYLTEVFELALHEVKRRLTEEKGFLFVEYELYPFDSERIVITASNRKIGEEEEDELRIPIVDSKTYSLSIENLRIEERNTLRGDTYCFIWNGSLVSVSNEEVYRAKVTPVVQNRMLRVTLSLNNVINDAIIIMNAISEVLNECIPM
ncbi:hypothetical protein [Sulfurisphaera tokodaii]|nr:hypothetical protein [Sulfurisphaera tokodaii]HII74198.1 hypothetical protein [Sulfurisphaera tokodaii]